MRIRIHYRDEHVGRWSMKVTEAGQIPEQGEYLAPVPGEVYLVVMTLHVLFTADYAAEVFAERVDFADVQKEHLGAVIWD